jgi:lipoyl-dependent peroxiredoxin
MPDKVLYTAEAVSTGDGRNGHVTSSDQRLDLDLAMPLSWAAAAQANPEQLFAAGYAACFHSALRLVAGRDHAALGDSTVTAQVGIGPEGDAFGLVVTLVIHVPGWSGRRSASSPTPRTRCARTPGRPAATSAWNCAFSDVARGNASLQLPAFDTGGPI